MIPAAVLDALLANGATAEMIVAAVKADACETAKLEEARLAKKRAGNLERQHRRRAVTRRHALSRTVTRDTSPYEVSSTPTEVTPVEANASTAPRGRADRGSKIPDDWQVPAPDALPTEARSLAAQWPPPAYRAEAEAFKNFWSAEAGARARKTNWNKAWANRIVAVHSKVTRETERGKRNVHRIDDHISTTERAVRNVVAGLDPGRPEMVGSGFG